MTLVEKIINNSFARLDSETDRERTAEIIEAIATSSTETYKDGTVHGRRIPEEIIKRLQESKNCRTMVLYDRINHSGVDASKVCFSPQSEWSMYIFRNIYKIYVAAQKDNSRTYRSHGFPPKEPPEGFPHTNNKIDENRFTWPLHLKR